MNTINLQNADSITLVVAEGQEHDVLNVELCLGGTLHATTLTRREAFDLATLLQQTAEFKMQ